MAKLKNLDGWGRHKARGRYAEGGDVAANDSLQVNDDGHPMQFAAASKAPQGDVREIPIRGQRSLNKAIQNADSDDELQAIKKRMDKRGLSTDFDAFR